MSLFKIKPTVAAVAALAVTLAGCRVEEPKDLDVSNVSGIASDALIINGTVRVIHAQSGRVVATTQTDASGFYEINDLKAPAGYYILRLEGGEYVEEASGTRIYLEANHFLESIQYHQPGDDLSSAITPLTSVAASVAQCKADKGSSLQRATVEASSIISEIYGVNIHSTMPANITDPANRSNILSSELKYGFIQAGRSEQVMGINEANGFVGHTQYSSIDLARIAYFDARYDCVLDGMGKFAENDPARQMSMGTVDITTETYRGDLARNIIQASASDYNVVGFGPMDVLGLADDISSSSNEIFDYAQVNPFDADGPEVVVDFHESQVVNGMYVLPITATDFIGVSKASLYIDGAFHSDAETADNPFFTVDTAMFSDGEHNLSVYVYDHLDNMTHVSGKKSFDNTGPVVEMLSPELANADSYFAEFMVTDANGISSVVIDGKTAIVKNGAYVTNLNLTSDTYSFDVVATDVMGEVTAVSYTLNRDTVKPIVDIFASDTRFIGTTSGFEQTFALDHNLSGYSFILDKFNFELGTTAPTRSALNASGYPYLFLEATDGISDWATPDEELSVKYRVKIEGGVVVPWKDVPKASGGYLLPFTFDYLSTYIGIVTLDDIVNVDIEVSDNAGNTVSYNWESSVAIQLNKMNYLMDDLDSNQLFGHRFIGARGGLLNYCTAANGSCTLAFPEDDEEIQAVIHDADYVEPFNDEKVASRQQIIGYSDYNGVEKTDIISPLSSMFAGYFEAAYRIHDDFALAYAEAETNIIADIGFNPMTVSPVDPLSETAFTEAAKHGLFLNVLSQNAFDVKGEFTPEYNSIAMAWASYRDLRDGVRDGFEFGAVTRVGDQKFGHDRIIEELGRKAVTIAEELGVSYLDEVVNYSEELFTPALPTVAINYPAGNFKGTLNISPIVDAESNVDSVLTFNGVEVATNQSVFSVDTTVLSDGNNLVEITVTDRWGQIASDSVTVFLDNTPPLITAVSNHITTLQNLPMQYSVTDGSGLGVVSVEIADIPTTSSNDVYQQTLNLSAGQNTITVRAEDALGNVTEHEMLAIVIDELPGDYKGNINYLNTVPNGNTLSVKVSGTTINPISNRYTIDTTEFSDGLHDIAIDLVTANGQAHSLTLEDYTLDNNAPVFTQVSPGIIQSNVYSYTAAVTDVGSEVVEVEFNGLLPTGISGDSYSRSLTMPIGFNSVVVQAEDRLGNRLNRSVSVARVGNLAGHYNGVVDLFGNESLPSNSFMTLSIDGDETTLISGDKVRLDTVAIADGPKQVSLEYTTANNDVFSLDLGEYVFDNVAPAIDLTSPILVDYSAYVFEMTVDDEFSEIASITINGESYDVSGNTGLVNVSKTYALSDDVTNFEVEVTDIVGNTDSRFFTVTRFDNFNALHTGQSGHLFGEGTLVLLENTPRSSDKISLELDFGAVKPSAPSAGSDWDFDTTAIVGGPMDVILKATDEYGNTASVTKSIIVDNYDPTLNVTSASVVITTDYLLEWNSLDEESGIESVTLDGLPVTVANAKTRNDFQIPKTLSAGETNYSIIVRDVSGKQRAVNHLVSVDLFDPTMDITTSSGRVWDIASGQATVVNDWDGSQLFIVQSALGGTDYGHAVTTDTNTDHWIKIEVNDISNAASIGTARSDLEFEFRQLADGVQVQGWSSDLIEHAPGVFYLPITTDYLDRTALTVGNKLNTIEFKVTDKVGRVTERDYSFRVMYQPNAGDSTYDASNVNSIAGRSIGNIQSHLSGQSREFGGVQFTNDYGQPVFIKVNSVGDAPSATLTKTQYRRVNRGRYIDQPGYYFQVNNGGTSFYTGALYRVTSMNSGPDQRWSDVQPADNGATLCANGSVNSRDTTDGQIVYGNRGGAYTAASNQYRNDNSTSVDMGQHSHSQFASINTGGKSTSANYYTGDPNNTNYGGFCTYSIFSNTQTGRPTQGLAFFTSPIVNRALPDVNPWFRMGPNAVYKVGTAVSRRWQSDAGYPRAETRGSSDENWGSVSVSGVEIYDSEGNKMPQTNGYVEVAVGETVTIRKVVSFASRSVSHNTPAGSFTDDSQWAHTNFAVTVDDDVEVNVVIKNNQPIANAPNMPFVVESAAMNSTTYRF